MGFSLESRRLIVEKMDKQFASDLDTRRKSNVVKKRASGNFFENFWKFFFNFFENFLKNFLQNFSDFLKFLQYLYLMEYLRYLWKFGFASKRLSQLRYRHL